MLDEPKGIRDNWARLVGMPHSVALELDVDVSDTDRSRSEYQVRGTVDVPSPPRGDDERTFMAKVLVKAADLPDKERRGIQLRRWVDAEGGSGVNVRSCQAIPHITDADIVGEINVFTPPEVEELDEQNQISSERHDEWVREYGANRYCRFETRQDLHQRWQDILVNTHVLRPSGKMGLTDQEFWYRLGQHVIVEMLLRGEPPNETNQDPRVAVAQPFFDGELCRKAAAVVSARGTDNDVIVKYGKYEHMRDLYENGLVRMNVASDYDKSVYNPAIRDDERAIVFKGGYRPAENGARFYNRDTAPEKIGNLVDEAMARFSTIYECPGLAEDEYAELKINMRTNYWMFCMAGVLDQRLFADFAADACVIIRKAPLIERLSSVARDQLPEGQGAFGRIDYVDPLGAYPNGTASRVTASPDSYDEAVPVRVPAGSPFRLGAATISGGPQPPDAPDRPHG